MKVEELTQIVRDRDRALYEQQAEVTKQRELLDHDRDIRELMGAHDLYIAEVHDVAGKRRDGKDLRPRLLHQGKVADLLRVRSRSGSGCKERQYISG